MDIDKWVTSRLNSDGLRALYRRMDVDGNQQLDFNEFTDITRRLQLSIPDELLLEVFKKFDQDEKTYLTALEFESAYHLLYDLMPQLHEQKEKLKNDLPKKVKENDDVGSINTKQFELDCSIYAVRYGFDRLTCKYIYESYRGTPFELNEKTVFFPDGTSKVFDLGRKVTGGTFNSTHVSKFKMITSFDTLANLVRTDNMNNDKFESNLMWWVDVAYKSSVAVELIRSFGLDKSLIGLLHDDSYVRKSDKRVFMTENTNKLMNGCAALSIFASVNYVNNIPLVDLNKGLHDTKASNARPPVKGAGALRGNNNNKNGINTNGGIGTLSTISLKQDQSQQTQLTSSSLLNNILKYASDKLSVFFSFSSWHCEERIRMLNKVYRSCQLLVNHEACPISSNIRMLDKNGKSLLECPSVYALSTIDIQRRPVSVKSDSLSIHMILNEHTQRVDNIITYRKIDNEADVNHHGLWLQSEYLACCGTVGRLCHAIRQLILTIILNKGVYKHNSELADSAAGVPALILDMLNVLNTDASEAIDFWTDVIEKQILQCAVGKHGSHIKQLLSVIQEMQQNIGSYTSSLKDLVKFEVKSNTKIASESTSLEPSLISNTTADIATAAAINSHTDNRNLRIKQFLYTGTKSNPWRTLVHGCRIRGKTGARALSQVLESMEIRVRSLSSIYKSALALQYTSTLRIITLFIVLSLPAILLSKYWSMNFENMAELNEDGLDTGGIQVYWIWWIVIYTVIFLVLFHCGFFYST